jgi:hypothetical protein
MAYNEERLELLQQGIPENQQQGVYNPFDEGVAKAISSARSNFGMTQDQEHAALRNSMLAMANSLSQNPLQKKGSVLDNFRTGISALAPAIGAYDQTENASLTQNNALAQQILAHKEREGQAAAQKEERLWHREHAENQLFETKKQHDETNANQKAMLDYKINKGNTQNSYLDEIAPLFTTDHAKDQSGKEAKAAAAFYSEVENVKTEYESLKTTMQKAGIDTTDPLAFQKGVRGASGIVSSFTKDPKQRAVATKYADVQASIKRVMQTAEKALKDGALTNFTVRYGDQNDLFPNFNETADVFETKLNHMFRDAEAGYDAAELSMRLRRQVNLKNYPKIKKWIVEQQQTSLQDQNSAVNVAEPVTTEGQTGNKEPLNSGTLMYDPETGEKDYIPVYRLDEALIDGLLVVE